jgi:hypothetical protein
LPSRSNETVSTRFLQPGQLIVSTVLRKIVGIFVGYPSSSSPDGRLEKIPFSLKHLGQLDLMIVHQLRIWDNDHVLSHSQSAQYRSGTSVADDQVAGSEHVVDVGDVRFGFDRDARHGIWPGPYQLS